MALIVLAVTVAFMVNYFIAKNLPILPQAKVIAKENTFGSVFCLALSAIYGSLLFPIFAEKIRGSGERIYYSSPARKKSSTTCAITQVVLSLWN